jgi:anti-anti-sigma regulatory factor
MTEVVNVRTGSVRVSGHLTVQGADLLRGTVETLHRSGHNFVLLDLRDVQAADDAGLHVLRAVRRELAADGGELVVRNLPTGPEGDGRPRQRR